jgi:hypothetical protein
MDVASEEWNAQKILSWKQQATICLSEWVLKDIHNLKHMYHIWAWGGI